MVVTMIFPTDEYSDLMTAPVIALTAVLGLLVLLSFCLGFTSLARSVKHLMLGCTTRIVAKVLALFGVRVIAADDDESRDASARINPAFTSPPPARAALPRPDRFRFENTLTRRSRSPSLRSARSSPLMTPLEIGNTPAAIATTSPARTPGEAPFTGWFTPSKVTRDSSAASYNSDSHHSKAWALFESFILEDHDEFPSHWHNAGPKRALHLKDGADMGPEMHLTDAEPEAVASWLPTYARYLATYLDLGQAWGPSHFIHPDVMSVLSLTMADKRKRSSARALLSWICNVYVRDEHVPAAYDSLDSMWLAQAKLVDPSATAPTTIGHYASEQDARADVKRLMLDLGSISAIYGDVVFTDFALGQSLIDRLSKPVKSYLLSHFESFKRVYRQQMAIGLPNATDDDIRLSLPTTLNDCSLSFATTFLLWAVKGSWGNVQGPSITTDKYRAAWVRPHASGTNSGQRKGNNASAATVPPRAAPAAPSASGPTAQPAYSAAAASATTPAAQPPRNTQPQSARNAQRDAERHPSGVRKWSGDVLLCETCGRHASDGTPCGTLERSTRAGTPLPPLCDKCFTLHVPGIRCFVTRSLKTEVKP